MANDENVDETITFATVAETDEELAQLLAERPHSWPWAVFASVLKQRRKALEPQVRDHRIGYAPAPNGQRISDKSELVDVLQDTADDVGQLSQQLHDLVRTPAFMGAFGPRFTEDHADADAIIHNANRVMDFYQKYLDIAARVRSVRAPSEYVGLLNDAARLVDSPLAGIDKMIDDYIDLVGKMPDLLVAAAGENREIGVALKLHADNDLWDSIIDRVEVLDD